MIPAATLPAVRPQPEPPVQPFRRGARPLRRKRRSRLLSWLGRLTPPLALLALPGAVAAWLLTSPRFALARVEVTTGERIEPAWVRRTLTPLAGGNLVRLPLSEVDRCLRGHPWVAEVEIHKALPDRLEVTVRERRPAALLARGESLWYADAEGRLIAPAGAGEDPELPLLREAPAAGGGGGGGGAAGPAAGVPGALAALTELAAHQPAWAAGLTELRLLGEEDFAVHTAAVPFPIYLRRGDVAAKGAWLEALLPEILRRYDRLEAVDLRYSRRIVLRMPAGVAPAAQIQPSEPAQREREVRSHG